MSHIGALSSSILSASEQTSLCRDVTICNLHQLRRVYLKGDKREYWMRLCEQAANEQDPEKLMELVKEINRLLEEKELRLKKESPKPAD